MKFDFTEFYTIYSTILGLTDREQKLYSLVCEKGFYIDKDKEYGLIVTRSPLFQSKNGFITLVQESKKPKDKSLWDYLFYTLKIEETKKSALYVWDTYKNVLEVIEPKYFWSEEDHKKMNWERFKNEYKNMLRKYFFFLLEGKENE